jgi:hypothetical protein
VLLPVLSLSGSLSQLPSLSQDFQLVESSLVRQFFFLFKQTLTASATDQAQSLLEFRRGSEMSPPDLCSLCSNQ